MVEALGELERERPWVVAEREVVHRRAGGIGPEAVEPEPLGRRDGGRQVVEGLIRFLGADSEVLERRLRERQDGGGVSERT